MIVHGDGTFGSYQEPIMNIPQQLWWIAMIMFALFFAQNLPTAL